MLSAASQESWRFRTSSKVHCWKRLASCLEVDYIFSKRLLSHWAIYKVNLPPKYLEAARPSSYTLNSHSSIFFLP